MASGLFVQRPGCYEIRVVTPDETFQIHVPILDWR